MSQLSALAREFSTKLVLVPRKSAGVFQLRETQLKMENGCRWVVFLDDDVILRHDSLHNLAWLGSLQQTWRSESKTPLCAYYQGTKWDVSNTRGYGNFDLERVTSETATNFNVPTTRPDLDMGESDLSSRFSGPALDGSLFQETYFCDTGFCMFDRKVVKEKGLSFIHNTTNTPAGGEDALFALQCESRNVPRIWIKTAEAIHLEKPNVRFGEFAYRKEAVLRTAEALKYPTNRLAEFLSWVPIHSNES